MAEQPLLRVEGIRVDYGPVRALSDVSIDVERGEIVCIMGVNGAGKTSLLQAISGVVPVSAGVIEMDGRATTGAKPWDLAREGIAHVPEGRRCFAGMSVEDNLRTGAFGAAIAGTVGVDDMFELFPILREKRRELGGNLSGGQQQMLAIARGLMASPRLLMLDEPSLGLAPIIVAQVRRALEEITQRFEVGILLVEQNTSLALPIAHRGYVLRRGRVIAHGVADDLRPTIEAAYLGQGA